MVLRRDRMVARSCAGALLSLNLHRVTPPLTRHNVYPPPAASAVSCLSVGSHHALPYCDCSPKIRLEVDKIEDGDNVTRADKISKGAGGQGGEEKCRTFSIDCRCLLVVDAADLETAALRPRRGAQHQWHTLHPFCQLLQLLLHQFRCALQFS